MRNYLKKGWIFMAIIARIIAAVITVALGIWGNYLFTPAWNAHSIEMWLFLVIMLAIGAAFFYVAEKIIDADFSIAATVSGSAAGILAIVLGICCCTGAECFRAADYQKMMEVTEASEEQFKADIQVATEETEPIIVDLSTARKLGDRTVGSIENISWYDVDNEYNLIKYQGELYRISELNYRDILKFQKAKYSGIPGYVLVNVKTQEAKYVELDEPIRYSPSAHFSYQLERHLRNLYPTYLFGSAFFEIDEEGNPYYIISVKTPTIGMFGGQKEESFILTNASTGESKEYKTEDLPEWVDHAFDLSYLLEVTNYSFKYKAGWWNSWTAQTGVYKTTSEYHSSYYNTAITSDGEIVFYTGVTPANNAESNVGFVLANPATGEVTFYRCDGAEETSAMGVAEGQVADFGYQSTFPTVFVIDGIPTYFMLLKDDAGTVQRYALCNIKDYTKVVQAETFEKVVEAYREKMGTKEVEEPEKVEILKTEGIITNLYQAQVDGCTFYYFTIEGSENLYMSSIKNNYKQVMLTEGTKVTIEYINTAAEGIFQVQKIQF